MRAELGRHRAVIRRWPDPRGPRPLQATRPAGRSAGPVSPVHVFPRVPGGVVAQAWPAATPPFAPPPDCQLAPPAPV